MAEIVLWDIDHTLVDTRGRGRSFYAAAFERVTGQVMRDQAKVDGQTEPVIFRETAKMHGISEGDADFAQFAQALVDEHQRGLDDLKRSGQALPGAGLALDALARAGVRQTVVSGNLRAVSELKLRAFGLDSYIEWGAGAFGDDGDQRADLVRLSLARARVAPATAVLVGDTPADVEGARANGVRVIGVASGHTSQAALEEAGADAVLADLVDTHHLVNLVRSGPLD